MKDAFIAKRDALLPSWLNKNELWECGELSKEAECWGEWLCGIRVSVAAVITLKQKWLISVLSPAVSSLGQILPCANTTNCCAHNCRAERLASSLPETSQESVGTDGLLSYFTLSVNSAQVWASDCAAQTASHGVKSKVLLFSFPLRTAVLWLAFKSFRKKNAGTEKQEVATHLGIAQHDHPHQHHVDVNSQRLLVVNLIHLDTKWDIKSQYVYWQRNSISFRASSLPR